VRLEEFLVPLGMIQAEAARRQMTFDLRQVHQAGRRHGAA
jgi:hypothetical protein